MAEILKIDNLLARIQQTGIGGKPVIRNRIYRVGVELEGGWDKLPKGVTELVHDGSVMIGRGRRGGAIPTLAAAVAPPPQTARDRAANVAQRNLDFIRNLGQQVAVRDGVAQAAQDNPPVQAAVAPGPAYTGELPSEILEVKNLQAWMEQHYPTHVNETCGMHVHMSFKKALHYSRLMVAEYPQTIVVYMSKWAHEEGLPKDHPLWPRLRGESQFCKLEFFPDEQARQTRKVYDHNMKGHRYTVINYCHAKTATIECRLLPMMDTSAQGIRAVKRIIDITNACLVHLKQREPKENACLTIDAASDASEESKKIYV